MKEIDLENGKYLIAIGGPTAVGKTKASILVAKALMTEIISADSRQIYKEMTIGTAKPDRATLDAVKHHFIDHVSIHDKYSAGQYEREGLECLSEIFEKHDYAVMTGGTGLYFKAIFQGLDQFPEIPHQILMDIESAYEINGLVYLRNELRKEDPQYFEKVDVHNPHRMIRALSVIKASGKPYSYFLGRQSPERSFGVLRILLELPRDELYTRINQRVINMMEEGLLKEAKKLYPYRSLRSLNTVGYKELFTYLDGEITLDEAIILIQRNSRRYAKRQLTWFSNQGEWARFHPDQIEEIIAFISNKTK